jgi:hypothetical protein
MNPKITRLLSILIFILLSNFFLQASTFAQQDTENISIGAYRIFRSNILNEDRTLLISLPRKGN